MEDNTFATIDECIRQNRKYNRMSNVYTGTIILGLALGLYGIFGIKKDIPKYCAVGTAVAVSWAGTELLRNSVKKRDSYSEKISELECKL